MKKFLKPALKILVSGLAIYFVFQKINWQEVWEVIQTANPAYIFLGLVFFALSNLIAAIRLFSFLKVHQLPLTHLTNLKLYLLGMFYNLFLPGGIGGDGYKVYWLNKQYESEVKSTIWSLLLDRINGLSALAFLAMLSFLAVAFEFPYKLPLVLAGLILMYPVYFLVTRQFFPKYVPVFAYTSFLSLLVQLSQMVCIFFLLLSLGIQTQLMEYEFIFLLSSIVAVIPFTIGGLGSREIVFLFGAESLGLASDVAVAVSLLFYLITVLVSFCGIVYVVREDRLLGPPKEANT